ncbi:hypothetical protein SEA_ROHR_93 [Mycobacterium phage Rohr]|nr:hypothetical protein SEA_ROHR_93 [Mycobacterium phage Rohr]
MRCCCSGSTGLRIEEDARLRDRADVPGSKLAFDVDRIDGSGVEFVGCFGLRGSIARRMAVWISLRWGQPPVFEVDRVVRGGDWSSAATRQVDGCGLSRGRCSSLCGAVRGQQSAPRHDGSGWDRVSTWYGHEKTPAVAGASWGSGGYRATRTLIRWWMSTIPLNRTKVRSDSMRRTTRSSGARTVPAPATMVSPTTTSAAGMVIRLVFISNSFLRSDSPTDERGSRGTTPGEVTQVCEATRLRVKRANSNPDRLRVKGARRRRCRPTPDIPHR